MHLYVDPNSDKEKKHLYRYITYPLFTFVAFGRSSPKLWTVIQGRINGCWGLGLHTYL